MVLKKEFGYMASFKDFTLSEVKIADAIANLKLVDPHGAEVQTALAVGMSFGSSQIG